MGMKPIIILIQNVREQPLRWAVPLKSQMAVIHVVINKCFRNSYVVLMVGNYVMECVIHFVVQDMMQLTLEGVKFVGLDGITCMSDLDTQHFLLVNHYMFMIYYLNNND